VIHQPPSKPEFFENDPDRLDDLLDVQLEQKRTEWKQASARYRAIRSISFVFLFLVIAGALLAFLFVFSPLRH
jgi:hypothetical protein